MVERIQSLLARFPENEEAVRELVAKDAHFDALCDQYHNVMELLDDLQAEVEKLRERRAGLEEELLTRIEGQELQ